MSHHLGHRMAGVSSSRMMPHDEFESVVPESALEMAPARHG